MGLPFIESGARKKRDQMIAVDLGTRTSKAVLVQRRGQGYALCGYTVQDAPIYEKSLPEDLLTEHLKTINLALGSKTKFVTLTIGVGDALVRPVDMPRIPADELRSVLKHNSRNYLQQDLSTYVFDCHVMGGENGEWPDENKGSNQKQKVLVAAARKQLVDEYVSGARAAGLVADHLVPALIGPVNAFELAMPDIFANEVVALVDIGFKSSSISILNQGQMVLNRTVVIGGDRLTSSLSESMNISYAEAEGIKIGMAHEVQSNLEATLTPLGRELRASIDFFEHQQDKAVSRVFLSGGSARAQIIVEALQNELMVETQVWNPACFLQLELPPEQAAELEHLGPQLGVALGAALTAL